MIGLLAFDPWLARDYGFALSAAATAGLLLLAGPLAERLSARDADAARRAARGAGRRAARLPADPHPARPGDRALRRAGQPARRACGTGRNRPRTDRVPRAPRAALGRGRDPAGRVGPRVVDRARRARRFGAPGRSAPVARPMRRARRSLAACTTLAVLARVAPACGDARAAVVAALLAVGLAVPVGVGVGAPVVAGATRPGTWDVAACDVGQGDAVLVRSAGATALIDTGPDPAALERLPGAARDRADRPARAHPLGRRPCRRSGRRRWDGSTRSSTARSTGIAPTASSARSCAGARRRSRSSPVGRATSATPAGACSGPRPRAAPGNDASVVIDLDAPGYRAVFLGDLGEGAQERMLALDEPRHGRPRQGGAPRVGRPERAALRRTARHRGRDRRRRRQRLRASDRAPARPPRARRAPPRCAPTARERRRSPPTATGGFRLWSRAGRRRRPPVGLTGTGGAVAARSGATRSGASRGRDVACEGPGHPAAGVEPGAPGARRARLGRRERARRACERHAARVPALRGSRARGERPRGRRLSAR